MRTAGRFGGNVSAWRRRTRSPSSLNGRTAWPGSRDTCCDADPEWGALLDNLHVRSDLKRQGIGRALMGETAATLIERRPASALYLWVLRQNVAAQAFYAALGGAVVDEELARPIAGGGSARVYKVAWRDPRVLLSALA